MDSVFTYSLNDKTTTSKHGGSITTEIYNEIIDNFYKYDENKVNNEIKKIRDGVCKSTPHLYKKYFEKIANDTLLEHSVFTINEVLSSEKLMDMIYSKTLTNDKVFNSTDITNNVKTAFRLGGKGFASKPPQFPLSAINNLLKEYKPKTYIDPCAGWGQRLIGSLNNKVEYIGFDINSELVNKLKELDSIFGGNNTFYNEDFTTSNKEIKGDLIFTSPPYFNIEKYENGKQVFTDDYNVWFTDFMIPMLLKMEQYCTIKGYIGINIKNTKKYPMYDDTMEFLINQPNLIFYEERDLKNIKRTKSTNKNETNQDEKILIFKKIY